MSKTIIARRRALLASSSLGLAAIASAASVAIALTPTVAAAQATCAAAPAPAGNGTNAVTLAAGTYNPEIACTYVGDNATVTTAGAITVSSAAPGGGVNLSAVGTGDVTWTSTAGVVTGGNQTSGPVIDASTQAGNITLDVMGVTGTQATITHGVRARSTGGGNISITHGGSFQGISASGSSGVAAIEAVSTGGDGDVSITSNIDGNNAISGRLYGILARASGSGELTVSHTGGVRISNTGDPNAVAMDLTTGTGKLTVNSEGPNATIGSFGLVGSFAGTALRANYGGDAEFNLQGVFGSGANWLVDLNATGGGATIINAQGTIGTSNNSATGTGPLDRRTIRVAGGGPVTMNLSGEMRGYVDFSAAGPTTLSVSDEGRWLAHGESLFGGGGDTVTVQSDGYLLATGPTTINDSVPNAMDTVVIDFGGGADRLVNAGTLVVGSGWQAGVTSSDAMELDLRLENLEAFENSGLIMMGAKSGNSLGIGTDRRTDDLLYMSGTTFTGSGDSTIIMDVNLSASQDGCDVALRNATTLDLPAADCVRIDNGATAGVTRLLVQELVPGDRGGLNQVVLVDVSGGESDVGHFVLHEDSPGYSPAIGAIDKGFFIYPLVYDAATQQHKLAGAPGGDAQQFTLLAQAGHGLWRLSTGSWLDRQADLRQRGSEGGGWLRVATEFAQRDVMQTINVLGNPFAFDNSHEQSSYAVTGGFDIVAGGPWVVGLTAGYVSSEVAYDPSPNTVKFDGWAGGAYASYVSGPLFVDAIVNANKLILKADVPALGLEPDGAIVDTSLLSVGGQMEAGYRFPLGGGAFIEPLGGLTYVRTRYDDLRIAADDPMRAPVVVAFDDPSSLRGSLGARVGLDQDYGGVSAQYSLLGRVWNEFEDETRAIATSIGSDALLAQDNGGTLSEFGVGASLYGLRGAVSGFFNFGGKFGDDYQSQNLSAGVRVNW